jgi:hypothetical protein
MSFQVRQFLCPPLFYITTTSKLDEALKAQIEAWLTERRGGKTKAALDNAAAQPAEIPMDIDEAT